MGFESKPARVGLVLTSCTSSFTTYQLFWCQEISPEPWLAEVHTFYCELCDIVGAGY